MTDAVILVEIKKIDSNKRCQYCVFKICREAQNNWSSEECAGNGHQHWMSKISTVDTNVT